MGRGRVAISKSYYIHHLVHNIIVAPQTAEEKLREHWRSNCPDLRRLESRQMQRAVEEEWKEQIEQRQEVWYRLSHLERLCRIFPSGRIKLHFSITCM